MIDTVRFKVNTTDRVISKLMRYATEFSGYDHTNEKFTYRVFRANLLLGSWEYGVNIFLGEGSYDYFFIEFSVPKLIYGNNLRLLPFDLIAPTLQSLYDSMVAQFHCSDIPTPIYWELVRIDLCYAWRLPSHRVAIKAIDYLKNLNYSRKKTAQYGTSVMFVGSDYSLKFYLKEPEFRVHDFNRIKSKNHDHAIELMESAKGVLRFEVTLRKKAIHDIFNVPYGSLNYIYTINEKEVISFLQNQLMKVLGVSPESMSNATAFDIFSKCFKRKRALQMYTFYRLFVSSDPTDRAALRDMPPSTFRRYKKIVRDLNIGLPKDSEDESITLTIPSVYSVGEFPPLVTPGGTAHI